jgi:type II secretory pathway component PulK
MRKCFFHRKGMTAVLAMLYMALFSTLALGFYASVTTAVQVARNEQRNTRTLL